nr:uncharacterized protein LOC129282089 [Lytechinus pictus]
MDSDTSTNLQRLPDMVALLLDDVVKYSVSASGFAVLVVVFFVYYVCCRRRDGSERDVNRVPYDCLFIDTTIRHAISLITWYCRVRLRRHNMDTENRKLLNEIHALCQTKAAQRPQDQHPTLISASVNTSLDLFFRVQKYPPGSEVIVTAINTSDTVQVLLHHGLQVIPLDVTRGQLSPDLEALRLLINESTVAILVTHLFGRVCDLSAVTELAHEHGVHVLEDCSQACMAPAYSTNPESDLVFFNFGVIYPCTAFGGGITRIKDKYLLEKMDKLQETYSQGSEVEYIRKAFKCTLTAKALQYPRLLSMFSSLARLALVDLKKIVNDSLTPPPTAGLVRNMRQSPPTSMTFMLFQRLKHFDSNGVERSQDVGDYVSDRLPQVAGQIGNDALIRGYWLFPILVDNPNEVCQRLNRLGIAAARGLAQIELIVSPSTTPDAPPTNLVGIDETRCQPTTASFIMDHIIYLPVHRGVPRHHLDQVCLAVEIVLNKLAILARYHASLGSRQKETHHGPYGPITPRRNKESCRRRMVSSNRNATSKMQQAIAANANRNDLT